MIQHLARNQAQKWGIKSQFPFAVMAVFGALMAAQLRAPAVLSLLLALVLLPMVYARDASKLPVGDTGADSR
jgi:hypothetical protein